MRLLLLQGGGGLVVVTQIDFSGLNQLDLVQPTLLQMGFLEAQRKRSCVFSAPL